MNKLLILACLLLVNISFAQDVTEVGETTEENSTLDWLTNLEEAEKISEEKNLPILIYFTGSDWCPPCKALKKDFFETPDFAQRAKGLVLVMIDYPRRMDIISDGQRAYNKTIIAKYNTNKSFPKIVMVNKKGHELGKLSGYSSFNTYQDTSYHFSFVDKYVAKSN